MSKLILLFVAMLTLPINAIADDDRDIFSLTVNDLGDHMEVLYKQDEFVPINSSCQPSKKQSILEIFLKDMNHSGTGYLVRLQVTACTDYVEFRAH